MASPAIPRKPSTGKRMFWMLLVVGLVFGAIFGMKAVGNRMMNQFFDNMPQPPAVITAAPARQATWTDEVTAVGTLVAVNGTDVTTEAGGVVRHIAFEPGEPVRAGQVLVNLNSSAELAQLRALEAQARLAVAQRQRWQELGKSSLVSRAEVEERVSQAASAQAEVEAQRARIEQKTVRAPFSGILGIRRVNLGQYVNPGDPIVTLQSLDPIFLDFTLPEQHSATVREGLPVTATVDALAGRAFEGTITAVEPRVDPATRNFRVQATLRNPEGTLRPGAFARVRLGLGGERRVVVVPQTAVSFNPYGNSVYVLLPAPKPKQPQAAPPGQPAPQFIVKQRFVRTGATRGDLVEITEGLKPGERVATSGLLKLRNDAAVVINNAVQPAADAEPEVQNR